MLVYWKHRHQTKCIPDQFSFQRTVSGQVKIVLMSATMDVKIFSDYFTQYMAGDLHPCPVLNIEGRMFDVSCYYLNQLEPLADRKLDYPDFGEPKLDPECVRIAVRFVDFDAVSVAYNFQWIHFTFIRTHVFCELLVWVDHSGSTSVSSYLNPMASRAQWSYNSRISFKTQAYRQVWGDGEKGRKHSALQSGHNSQAWRQRKRIRLVFRHFAVIRFRRREQLLPRNRSRFLAGSRRNQQVDRWRDVF